MYHWCQKQKTEELHDRYVKKATRNLNQVLYFVMSVIWGYSILKNSPWIPHFLGG